jgi:hypothetical protein
MRPSQYKDEMRPKGPSLFLPKSLSEEYFDVLRDDDRHADLQQLKKYYRRRPMRKLACEFPDLTTAGRIWVDPMRKPTQAELIKMRQIIESAKYRTIRPSERIANPYYEFFFREIEFGSVYPLYAPPRIRSPEALKNHPELTREGPLVIKLTTDKGTRRPKGIALPQTITDELESMYARHDLAGLRWRVGYSLRNPDQLVLMPDKSQAFSVTVRRLDQGEYPECVSWHCRDFLVLRRPVTISATEDRWRVFLNLPAGAFAADEPGVERLPLFTLDTDPVGNLFITRIVVNSEGNLAASCRLHPDRDLEVERFLEEVDREDL